jgi:Fur family transcriptional regulator, zinc uptake regulator
MTTQVLTKNQTLVLDALTKAEAPLSAYTILDKLREHGFRAPLQVYRALEKLTDMGLVHRLESINSFVACAHTHEDGGCHSHGLIGFAICEICGQVAEFHDHAIDQRLSEWAHSKKFRPAKTTIEIRGTCQSCLS